MPEWIEEGDPLPPQPDAQPRVTMSGMGLTIQGDIGGLTLGMERHVDATVDERDLNDILDGMTKAFWRQQAHPRLVEAMVEVRVRRDKIAALPASLAAYRQVRRIEREHIEARARIEHNMSGRRAPFEESRTLKANLTAFDEQTRAEVEKMEAEAAKFQHELPQWEAQITRQRAILAGASRADVMDEGEPLAQAAE